MLPSSISQFTFTADTTILVKWIFKSRGMIISSPICIEGKVIVGSNDKNIYALDETSGEEIWRFKSQGQITSTPAISNDKVYFGSMDGHYYAIDLLTGKEIWKFKTGFEKKIGSYGLWGMLPSHQFMEDQYDFIISSPLIKNSGAKTTVYFGSSDGYLYALNAETGSLIWKFKTNGPIRSTPSIYRDILLFGSWDTYVYALDPATGKEIWKYKTESDTQMKVLEGIQASPVGAYDRIYLGARDGYLHVLDYKTGNLDWKFNAENSWVVSTATVRDSMVYTSTSDSYLVVALNAITGVEKFRLKTHGYNLSSPLLTEKGLFIADFSGMIHQVNPISGKTISVFETEGRIKNKKTILDKEGNLNFEYTANGSDMQFYDTNEKVLNEFYKLGSFISSPSYAKNTLYIGSSEGYLYALSIP
ncbi:PQQ-binding-like beta-propeller repeat protein [Sphingobacterium tabacisoli]|uniref:PQQ-binding-like beta-propeller repeat protein n=2 Tax=Sphingobacterium tabacisoli TaxID=2044855 RepID=A0ABW5L6D8_9SPHI